MTFLVVHQSTAEAIVVEYGDRAGAESCAELLANTQGGTTRVFAAFELRSYVRARDLDVVPEAFEDAEQYLRDAAAADTHSSDVEPSDG
jgi:hypothetical protein